MSRRPIYPLVAALLAISLLPQVQGAQAADTAISGEYASDQIIVAYEDQGNATDNAKLHGKTLADVEGSSSRPVSAKLENIRVVKIGKNFSVNAAIERLKNQPGVLIAEPDFKVYSLATPSETSFTDGTLWGMYGPSTTPANSFGTGAAAAWARGLTGSPAVAVGVIDEGIQITHPDLVGNIWINPGETKNGIDDDGNGYVDDVNGWDFYEKNNTVFDGNADPTIDAHGTHVSGTIGARANNSGVVGVNWDVKIISAKFLGPSGGLISDAIAALDYLTNLKLKGVNIAAINNSWGGGGFSQLMLDAINRAGNAGILFVAAAGNSASNNDSRASYPSNYQCTNGNQRGWDCVIAVSAINKTGGLSYFSSYGLNTVDLGAPGEDIYSSVPNNTWDLYSGTSMATPHVTGAIALCAAANASGSNPMTPSQIRAAVLSSSRPITSLRGKTVSGGTLNIDALSTICYSGYVAQAQLTITNSTLTVARNAKVSITTSGGSGTGALSYVTTSTCAITSAGVLTSKNSKATSCTVSVAKAASDIYGPATSTSVKFTFQ